MDNLDKIKSQLTLDEVFDFVQSLGGEPRMSNEKYFISRTICHNPVGEGSYKLYYYDNAKLFHCYTGCDNATFDIFELVQKVHKMRGVQLYLYQCVYYVAAYFSIPFTSVGAFSSNNQLTEQDWQILNNYKNCSSQLPKQTIEMQIFEDGILKYLPQPRIPMWEQEGISYETIKSRNIKYDPVQQGIVIPHYDKNGNLIGIRERTLIEEEEARGKYKPAILNGQMYNHPLGFNLYNLNFSKEYIAQIGRVFVFEGEKATLQYASNNRVDLSVACCGSNLSQYQFNLLMELEPDEIVIGFDKQFKEIGDDEFQIWTKKLRNIWQKYNKYTTICFLFDKWGLLDYKDSPLDKGIEVFKELYRNRIYLE